jgi:iron complex transport system substrate-binding protein
VTSVVGWNVAAFAAAVGLSTSVAWFPPVPRARDRPAAEGSPLAAPAVLRDHRGSRVPAAPYRRIASASPIADGLLLELCEPDRVASFTPYSGRSRSFRYAGKPMVRVEDLEGILSLQPDLVLVSGIGDAQPIERLRDAGLVVFDLGEPHGMDTLAVNIAELADLIDAHARGVELSARVADAMRLVAADIPQARRQRAMYLSVYGGRLFGGSVGTSYHDVLVAAGLVEAADRYKGWPSYSTEEVLEIDPELVVTAAGMRGRICEHAGFELMHACRAPAGIVEVESALLSDPGLAMVDAARAVRRAVYGLPR